MELVIIIIAVAVAVDDIARKLIDLKKYQLEQEFSKIRLREWEKDE